MLRSVKQIIGYRLGAKDGKIGRCKDFFFDDERWTIRYIVADTGTWLSGRMVLIPILSLGEPDWSTATFTIKLTKDQIEKSPPIESDAPVSRRREADIHKHYNWPLYWGGAATWGLKPFPDFFYESKNDHKTHPDTGDQHLRSVSEVTGYNIEAKDGDIGHVEDFIVDDESWIIRYLVVDTRNWLPGGKKVLVSPAWIEGVFWGDRTVMVSLRREKINSSPAYNPALPVNRKYETALYDFYGRLHYW